MALQLDDLPNEVLSNILTFLDTNEKFQARTVCKKWKNQIDDNVPFHAIITDKNYNLIRLRFGTGRIVKSLEIYDYKRQDIPIHNLRFLRYLFVGSGAHKTAVDEVLTRAIKLNELKLVVDHGKENAKIQPTEPKHYPALVNIRKLCVSYNKRLRACGRAWNPFLNCKMPNVQCLEVVLYPNVSPLRGFDFFRLAAGMPNLCNLTFKTWCSHTRRFNVPGDVQPITPEISRGLHNLQLSSVDAIVMQKDENVWKDLLAAQRHLKEITLLNELQAERGFHMSMILSCLQTNSRSIRTLALDIDTKINGDVDAEIFSSLQSLQELTLYADPFRTPPSNILNCSSLLTRTLKMLYIKGFRVAENDLINVIKKVPLDELNTVEIGPELASVWREFDNRLYEMRIKMCEISSNDPTKYIFAPKTLKPKVYYGMTLEPYKDYQFSGLEKRNVKKNVKDITVEREYLYVETNFKWMPSNSVPH